MYIASGSLVLYFRQHDGSGGSSGMVGKAALQKKTFTLTHILFSWKNTSPIAEAIERHPFTIKMIIIMITILYLPPTIPPLYCHYFFQEN